MTPEVAAAPTKRGFAVAFVVTLVAAAVAWWCPRSRAPLDFDAMLWFSFPLAGLWVVGVAMSVWRFGKRAWWMLVGAPPALYWPVWLLVNGFPACYWQHNCA